MPAGIQVAVAQAQVDGDGGGAMNGLPGGFVPMGPHPPGGFAAADGDVGNDSAEEDGELEIED